MIMIIKSYPVITVLKVVLDALSPDSCTNLRAKVQIQKKEYLSRRKITPWDDWVPRKLNHHTERGDSAKFKCAQIIFIYFKIIPKKRKEIILKVK